MPSPSQNREEPLGKRLQERRQALGASLDQLAGWSGLEIRRLEEIESGEPMRSWEFESICRGLAVDPGAMARGEDRTPRRSVARFRAADWLAPVPEDLRVLALAAELGRIGGYLASQVAPPAAALVGLRDPLPVSGREPAWKQGYRLGEKARGALVRGTGPILELEALLTDRGVHVARVPFSSPDLDAASLWESGALPVILLNARSPRTHSVLSRRALLAHELCHLLHDTGERDLTTELSWREGTGNYSEATEQRARAFAPAFLAPRDEVRQWFRTGEGRQIRHPASKVEEIARRWGFSVRGAVWHAKNCQVITPGTAERLDREIRNEEHDWSAEFERGRSRGVEAERRELGAVHIAPIADGLVASLAAQAVAAGSISEGRGQEIVTWA